MKKRRNIPVYTDDMVKMYTQLTIQVDDAGNEWLNPEQVDFLEFVHAWARYEGVNQLRASRTLVRHYLNPIPDVGEVKSSNLSGSLVKSTPAFSGVLV